MKNFRVAIVSSVPLALFGALVLTAALKPAEAVPSFADQTGQDCKACHVGAFGPQLTPFGRQFKLRGYTMRTAKNVPISAMAVASWVHTAKAQEEPPAEHSKRNNNLGLDEASIFLAGGLGSHVGGFAQVTYSGADRAWAWDMLDLRLVGDGKLGSKDLIYGLSLNNNPTLQDAWNTLGVWGYPYTESDMAPAPAAAPLIDGGLGQSVLGLTAYSFIDSTWYVEAGGYSSPSRGTLNFLGSDPFDPGRLHGIAPYGRAAVQVDAGGGTLEAGLVGLHAALYPGRDTSAGRTDRYTDIGVDASWLKPTASGTLTIQGRYIHEKQSLDATCLIGMAEGSIPVMPLGQCADATLNELHGDVAYSWHDKIGATIGAFDTWGSRNGILYAANRALRPNSSGLQFQLDYTLFGRGGSPLGRRPNMRVGVQYTAYSKFDGASHNYDGSGRDASDNNTVRVFSWLSF